MCGYVDIVKFQRLYLKLQWTFTSLNYSWYYVEYDIIFLLLICALVVDTCHGILFYFFSWFLIAMFEAFTLLSCV